jgi:exonuclease III
MRIATWNLERPSVRSWRKLPCQLEQIAAINADVWILTETRASIQPSAEHCYVVHAPPHSDRRPDEDERWVSIWSRFPLEDAGIEASPRGTVAAVVDSPLGHLALYGTVVPWHSEPSPDGVVRPWSVHAIELQRQAGEWRNLASRFAGVCVVGDFNQSWQGRGYGTRALRATHHDAAQGAGLVCLTAGEVSDGLPVIDHVLLSRVWVDRFSARVAATWPGRRDDGTRMSDHAGVAVDIDEN